MKHNELYPKDKIAAIAPHLWDIVVTQYDKAIVEYKDSNEFQEKKQEYLSTDMYEYLSENKKFAEKTLKNIVKDMKSLLDKKPTVILGVFNWNFLISYLSEDIDINRIYDLFFKLSSVDKKELENNKDNLKDFLLEKLNEIYEEDLESQMVVYAENKLNLRKHITEKLRRDFNFFVSNMYIGDSESRENAVIDRYGDFKDYMFCNDDLEEVGYWSAEYRAPAE